MTSEETGIPPEDLQRYPIERDTVRQMFDMILWETGIPEKKKMLAGILKAFPFLTPLCEHADECFDITEKNRKKVKKDESLYAGSVPEIILTVAAVVAPTVEFFFCGDTQFEKYTKEADRFVDLMNEDSSAFSAECQEKDERHLLDFIACQLYAIHPPANPFFSMTDEQFREIFRVLFAWGLYLSELRAIQEPPKDEIGFPVMPPTYFDRRVISHLSFTGPDTYVWEKEEYDFDRNDLREFLLRIDFWGDRNRDDCYVDVLVREDNTFEDLYRLLERQDELDIYLPFRFTVVGSVIFVRDKKEMLKRGCWLSPGTETRNAQLGSFVDVPPDLSEECFIGHHISREATGNLLEDESISIVHASECLGDIKIKRIMRADTRKQYPELIKIQNGNEGIPGAGKRIDKDEYLRRIQKQRGLEFRRRRIIDAMGGFVMSCPDENEKGGDENGGSEDKGK
jgi:hypothetical protein